MNQKTKIAVTPAKASELLAQGYEIECYLILPPADAKVPCERSKPVSPETRLRLSTEGTPPKKGGIAAAFVAMRDHLFKKDPRKTYTRAELETWFKGQKFKWPENYVSQLIHKHHVLRVVE
jgi:hypothetical protein